MAKLPDDILRFIDAAHALCDAFANARIVGNGTELVFAFKSQIEANALQSALVGLEYVRRDFDRPSVLPHQTFLGAAATTLEAQPTKPLDVEIRQWALALVLQVYGAPFSGPTMQARERAANVFVQYAITGAMPAHATGPEDAA